MDGNNSLKLVDSTFCTGTTRTDDCTSMSARWINPKEVDQFKDEVAMSRQNVSHTLDSNILRSLMAFPIAVSTACLTYKNRSNSNSHTHTFSRFVDYT